MNMNESIDDHELQRLLDGTLSQEDRSLLCQHAEEHPANWRRIAMAFMEEQVLRDQLKDLAEVAPLESAAGMPSEPRSSQSRHGLAFWGQAAAWVLLLGAAVWAGRASVAQPSAARTADSPTESFSPGDYTIVLTPGGRSSGMATPAFQDNQDALERMFTPLFDQRSQGVFREHGYTVNEEPVIYVVRGADGEQFVVPRRNVSFVAHQK